MLELARRSGWGTENESSESGLQPLSGGSLLLPAVLKLSICFGDMKRRFIKGQPDYQCFLGRDHSPAWYDGWLFTSSFYRCIIWIILWRLTPVVENAITRGVFEKLSREGSVQSWAGWARILCISGSRTTPHKPQRSGRGRPLRSVLPFTLILGYSAAVGRSPGRIGRCRRRRSICVVR